MIDLRTYYAGYRLRLIKLEQEWLEIRARHWIKGDHGYFAGSYSTGGGAGAKKTVDKAEESGIINKKIADRMKNENIEYENGIFEFTDIEEEMEKSPIGIYTLKYIEDEKMDITMDYDLKQPDDLCGIIVGKNIYINAAIHEDETQVAETIIHECAHRQFSWNVTQEDEINCRIYEYLHSHESISDGMIRSIVDFVRDNYSEDPEGNLYGY